MARALRWRTVSVEALIWHEFDDELVVRNAMSGSTHLLDFPATEVLKALVQAKDGMTAAECARAIGEEGSAAAVDELLREFQRHGLAEPVN
jgi:PqqD family protein of HPr-rel-A system